MLRLCVRIIYLAFRPRWKLLFFNKGLINEKCSRERCKDKERSPRESAASQHPACMWECVKAISFFSLSVIRGESALQCLDETHLFPPETRKEIGWRRCCCE